LPARIRTDPKADRDEACPPSVEAGDKAAAQSVYKQSAAVLDRIADKWIILKNKASRTDSRLSAQIKELAAA
jgi:small subunit ribosomal protein S20